MALIRHIASQFSLVYLKPATMARAVRELAPIAASRAVILRQQRRQLTDRRSGYDRRQSQQRVIIEMRSSYSRRLDGRRRGCEGDATGVDVYA